MAAKKGYSVRKNVLVKYQKDDSEFIIPDGVEVIGVRAFAMCGNLKTVTIPDSVKRIDPYAFYFCKNLASVTIPNSVTTIGGYAFANCSSITKIDIPKSVTDLGGLPFAECRNITNITVNSGNPVYHADGNCLIETANKKIIYGCNNSTIPTDGSVTSIDGYAFKNCLKLTRLYIPSCITSIGRMAFDNCKNLIFVTAAGSYAAQYGKDNKIPVEITFEKD
jgi:hypothetical protein